jgi:hypothetical protein
VSDQDDSTESFFEAVRQGHVFVVPSSSIADASSQLVAISQTCDIVLRKRPTIVLADVVELDGAERSEAAKGANPRYVPLPSLGVGYFADLCFIETRLKEALVGASYVLGIDLADEGIKRDFSLSLMRWFGRFPFPDDVVPWLRPLESVIRTKYSKDGKLGSLLRDVVVEIRVQEEKQWREPPYKFVVHTIVRAEKLPTLEDDGADASAFVASLRDLDDKVLAPTRLADIYADCKDPRQKVLVLDALAESFAKLCEPSNANVGDASLSIVVNQIDWQLWSDDEFPISRLRKSEPLDLEYLSEPEHRI